MALTTAPWSATTLVAYINEVWPGVTDKEFFTKPLAANFFRDLTEFAQNGGDIFHIPDVFSSSFVIQSQSTQGAEVTTVSPTVIDNTLTINKHNYIATLLGDVQQRQVAGSYSLGGIYNRKAVGHLVEGLEGALFALQSSVTTNTHGDTATVITDADLRVGISQLETADFPRDELAFFFHPYSYYAQLLAIQKYYDASQAGWMGNMGPVVSGNFGSTPAMENSRRGTLFGIPVFTSSAVVNTLLGVKNLLAHKDAFTWASQTPGGRIRTQAAYWLENLGILTVWDMMYGVTANREGAAVLFNGSNAFISS